MLLLLWVCNLALPLQAAEPQMRLRIAWGGGARRQWEGQITVDRGSLSKPEPLGIEADGPGSIWVEHGAVKILQRSDRTYDAFDVSLVADAQATLTVELWPVGQPEQRAAPQKIPVSQLISGTHNSALDDQSNLLLVRRAPGDTLRVTVERSSLVVAPGEQFTLRLQPDLPGLAPEASAWVRVEVQPARGGRAIWSKEFEVKAPAASQPWQELAVDIPAPLAEGAYDIVFASGPRLLRQRLAPVVRPKPLVERTVQFVVVSADRPPLSPPVDWRVVGEIDLANPAWWKRLSLMPQLTLTPAWKPGPLEFGRVERSVHPLGPLMRFGEPEAENSQAWEAVPIPIDRPGVPHILEVEYPSGGDQNLGISIVEPDAVGAVVPIGVDSGVWSTGLDRDQPAKLTTHRLLFWPKTKSPLVLLTQRGTSPAFFGKLRVLSGPVHLAPAYLPAISSGRLAALYYDRPLLPENFSATGVADPWSGQCVDDWQTFYEASIRMVEYARHIGYNGAMLSVLADGSAIYPSDRLQSTPRYDTGAHGAAGRDPVRKDVVELVMRICDREGMKLIPALHFSAPLPELETLRRDPARCPAGLELVNASGARWLAQHPPQRGLAPYYNPLCETVQREMLAVVRELARRYATHPAFDGLAIQLAADGYALLPGPEWGLDDETIARFERDTNIQVPRGQDAAAVYAKHNLLLRERRGDWVRWRAREMAVFYGKLLQEVQAARPGAKLYLAGATVFEGEYAQKQLRPALPQLNRVDQVLLELGIAPELFPQGQLVLLGPKRILAPGPIAAQAVDVTVNQGVELDRQLAASSFPASLFYHPPQRLRLESFDERSPFGAANTHTLLVSQPSPSGDLNRQRFIRSLAALDALAMFDGGWLAPLGQEDALRSLLAVYRQLPAARFKTSPVSRQPVIVRTHIAEGQTYVYLINNSPWPIRAQLRLSASQQCQFVDLRHSGAPQSLAGDAGEQVWGVDLAPYDLAGARFTEDTLALTQCDLTIPDTPRMVLEEQIQDLSARAAALANQPSLSALVNAGFELTGPQGEIQGWSLVGAPQAAAVADPAQRLAGKQSLRLSSPAGVASLQSELIDVPVSGRLAVAVSVRTADLQRQPVLRLAVEGAPGGPAYYRFAPVGGQGPGTVPLKNEWTPYLFQIDDLPPGITQVRVRFDLMQAGTVWLDQVELYDLKFNHSERVEISKILVSARGALTNGELDDCLRMLEGFWPRYLTQNVPLADMPIARNPRPAARSPQPVEEKKPGVMERMRGIVPRLF